MRKSQTLEAEINKTGIDLSQVIGNANLSNSTSENVKNDNINKLLKSTKMSKSTSENVENDNILRKGTRRNAIFWGGSNNLILRPHMNMGPRYLKTKKNLAPR